MNLNNNANIAAILPNIRDIFFAFDFSEHTIPVYERNKRCIRTSLKEKFETFEEYDEIDRLIVENSVESQAIGFQQGFSFAMNLIKGGAVV